MSTRGSARRAFQAQTRASRGADVGRVATQTWGESRRRCGASCGRRAPAQVRDADDTVHAGATRLIRDKSARPATRSHPARAGVYRRVRSLRAPIPEY